MLGLWGAVSWKPHTACVARVYRFYPPHLLEVYLSARFSFRFGPSDLI